MKPNDSIKTPGNKTDNEIVDRLIDGVTSLSILTAVAYAIVFGFEEGFNAFFQIPADYVATSFLSVFHVLSLVVYTMIHDIGIFGVEAAALLILVWIPARVFANNAAILGLLTFGLYAFSTALKPFVLLLVAILVCLALFRWKLDDVKRPRLIDRLGENFTKGAFIFLLLLTPLYYFGFRYAEIQDPRLVLNDEKPWIVARILDDNFVAVRVLDKGDSVRGCVEQYPKRVAQLSRDLKIVGQESGIATWRYFGEPLGYCVFLGERPQLGNTVANWLLFLGDGPSPASSTPLANPSPSSVR